jgi:hypothetical protein
MPIRKHEALSALVISQQLRTQRSSGADFEAGLFLGEAVGVFMII